MSHHRVVALLDRPSPRSFGMVPFVEQKQDGSLVVHGLKGRPARSLPHPDFEELVASRSALAVDVAVMSDLDDTHVAGWLGSQFVHEFGHIPAGVPAGVGEERHRESDQGWFWFTPRDVIRDALNQWVAEAASEVFERGDARLANLMAWVLPDSDVTRAAILSTKTDEERRERLAWWLRLERDAGRPTTADELMMRLLRIRDEYQSLNSRRLREVSPTLIHHRSKSAAPFFPRTAPRVPQGRR